VIFILIMRRRRPVARQARRRTDQKPPRQSGDNGLVETKNAAIVRKHIGWGHIDPGHANRVNEFYTGFLNPYVNFHRPSAQPRIEIDPKGRKRRLYRQWLTPLEKLLSLDRPQQYLRAPLTVPDLERVAAARCCGSMVRD
jgi:hypothetical protein